MYEKELQHLGLSEKEARVYIASLELGADTAQHIAQKATINRATTYVQIEALKKKGLMSEFEKGKKTLYVVESPDRLQSLLRVFEKELDLKKDEIKRILPALLELAVGAKERPKVKFYEGPEGVQAIWEDFLKTKRKVIEGLVNRDEVSKLFPTYPKAYSSKRVEKGIRGNIIYTSRKGPDPAYGDPAQLRTAKFISYEKLPLTADITIYDNKIALLTYKTNPIGIIIESKEIAESMRAIFYVIWNSL